MILFYIFYRNFNFRLDSIQMLSKLRREFRDIKWIASSTYVDVEQRICQFLDLQNPIAIRQTHSIDQLVQHEVPLY